MSEPSSSQSNSPIDQHFNAISDYLDNYVYLPILKSSTGQFEFSLTSFAHLTKVSNKLKTVKVICAVLSFFCALTSVKYFFQGHIKSILYLAGTVDLFLISYNAFDRNYARILGQKTLSSPVELSSSIISMISSNLSGVKDEKSKVSTMVNDINWNYLLTGTITEFLISKVRILTL